MANKPADDAADIKETTNAETIKNVNSTYAQGPINKCSLKRTHSPSTIEENKDYDNIPSKFLIAELNGNESLADISPNNILEQLVNANGSLEIAHSSPENYSDPIQFQIENRLEQIELKLETIDSKLDSFLISIQKILEQKQNESTTFGRTATHSERAAKVKVEIDADFVPPALPICINDDLLTLDEKCRSNACYMEQMVVLLISEANVILLDSKCEKKLVRGFMEILFSYDLLENYTLSGAAGFNGNTIHTYEYTYCY